MHSSPPPLEFDLTSLAEAGLQQKLTNIELEYKRKSPVIQMAVVTSKRLVDTATTKSVADTEAILKDMMDRRENILFTHDNKIKEIDSIILAINREITAIQTEILQIETVIEELETIEKESSEIDEQDMLVFQSVIKASAEVEEGGLTDKPESLTIRNCIEHMRRCESNTRKDLERFEEKKKKSLERKDSWNVLTQGLIQKLDEAKEEHLKKSHEIIKKTIEMGEKNIERGEQYLKTLERKYGAVLKYRRLRYFDNLPNTSSAPTPR